MKRREFLTTSCAAGLISLAGGATMAQDQPARLPGESEAAYRTRLARMRAASERPREGRLPNESEAAYRARMAQARQAAAAEITRAQARGYYELRRYEIETAEQKAGFDRFLSEAAVPTLNRLGIRPVGVFYPEEGLSPVYVLLPHESLQSFAALAQRLAEDEEFLSAGAEFIDAPADKPAYKNLETQLMMAFEGMPRLETPIRDEGRIFQLRTYESPSEKTGLKKIEMFNTAELAIFRRVGLHPVFFGQTLAGTKMPNLTYMLVFKDQEQRKANWKAFGGDPEWQTLRAMPEYADQAILRRNGITNLFLKPAAYSQV